MDILEQLDKLIKSAEMFREDYIKGEKRLACGHMDYVQDRSTKILYLTLAEIEDEDLKNNN